MGCEAVTKGMNADAFVNTSPLLGTVVGLLRHTLVDVTLRFASFEQEFLGMVLFLILPQVFQQMRGQNRVPVLASFSLDDADGHAGAVDIVRNATA